MLCCSQRQHRADEAGVSDTASPLLLEHSSERSCCPQSPGEHDCGGHQPSPEQPPGTSPGRRSQLLQRPLSLAACSPGRLPLWSIFRAKGRWGWPHIWPGCFHLPLCFGNGRPVSPRNTNYKNTAWRAPCELPPISGVFPKLSFYSSLFCCVKTDLFIRFQR